MDYPMPTMEMTEENCRKDFNKLKGTWVYDILREGEWFGRSEDGYEWSLDYEGKQWYFARNNIGNKASNYFQQENRWSVDGSVSPGPKRTWENEKFMTSLMGSAYSLKLPKIDRSALRVMIGLRKYICSQFKPNVAKAMYDYFDVKNVLDFSMGWGDRLAGFYASPKTELYVGVDPRKENHPIYQQQADYYDNAGEGMGFPPAPIITSSAPTSAPAVQNVPTQSSGDFYEGPQAANGVLGGSFGSFF